MSQNIHDLYISNPATSLQSTDLMYLGRSPYGTNDDFAFPYSLLQASIPGSVSNDTTGASATLAGNQAFMAHNAGLVTFTLPASIPFGQFIDIIGFGAGGWAIAQLSGQEIFFGNQHTTIGATGSLASTDAHDCVRLFCAVANTTFVVVSSVGNLTVV